MIKTIRKRRENERGAVLVITLLVTVMILIMTMPFLTKLSGSYRLTEKSYRTLVSTNLAEAGIERAIWELNYGSIWTWNGEPNNRTLELSDLPAANGNEIGDISVSIQAPLGQMPFIESTGKVMHIGSTSIDRTVRVLLVRIPSPSVFTFGLFGDEGINLVGSATVDSYDSRKGAYGDDNVGEKGHSGTNATYSGCIGLMNNSTISGSAFVGPGADPADVIVIQNNSAITGVQESLLEEKLLPSVPPPEGLPFLGDYVLPVGSSDVIFSDAEYSLFWLRSNTSVTIASDVILYVTGQFKMDSNSVIDIAVGAHLTLYLGGTFVQHSNSQINNLTMDPTEFIVYGTESFSSMDWRSNSNFYGAVYAPQAIILYNSNADFSGSLIGRKIDIDSNGRFHYDLALGDVDTIGDGLGWNYSVKSWHQAIGN
ncbi:MAG: hypothetical protein MUP98_07155 [Candidatus Aminicenantes bacterium]|nr:hypothetical protein [Candidatus Aminicenantes bacterium]